MLMKKEMCCSPHCFSFFCCSSDAGKRRGGESCLRNLFVHGFCRTHGRDPEAGPLGGLAQMALFAIAPDKLVGVSGQWKDTALP